MMDTLVALLAVPGIVLLVQSIHVPETWYAYKPLGCPLCLSYWASAAVAVATVGSGGPGPVVLQTLAGLAVAMLVAAAAPWLFRWDASDDHHNP